MRSIFLGTAGLVLLGAALLGQPALQRADGQPPTVSAGIRTGFPQASQNLPADLIDSRPIVAYFDNRPMPDTVRDLLTELKQPDRCGKGADVRPAEACALVFYKLDEDFTPDRLRPPFIMKAVYRVSDAENPANTVITMPDGKGVLQRYTNGDLYEPLRSIRANICLKDKRTGPDKCNATDSKGVLYRPYAILGKLENDREGILPAKSARKHFTLDLQPADAEWLKEELMRDLCHQGQTGIHGGQGLLVC